ncbi:Rho GTPase activation protein, partial [Obelidium mucronatum]
EGDVDLINCNLDMMDVHVVSGLLKLYLRELPTPVLTKNLQNEFMAISNFDDRNDRILQLAHLLSLLPRTNYILLETLISHLVSIVQASNVNKMSVRNVGIVFAPTLGVPALVFILLLAEFNDLFCWDDEGKTALMKERIREMHVRKEREAVVAASVAAAANPLPENVGDSIADRSSDGESPKRDLSPTGEG